MSPMSPETNLNVTPGYKSVYKCQSFFSFLFVSTLMGFISKVALTLNIQIRVFKKRGFLVERALALLEEL